MGVTLAELRVAYARTTGEAPPPAFGADVASLVRGGHLVRAGGRAGRTRYARPAFPADPRPDARQSEIGHAIPDGANVAAFGAAGAACLDALRLDVDDLAGAVVAALASAPPEARASGLPARTVADAVAAARGVVPHGPAHTRLVAAVRSVLHTLARPRTRGPEGARGPLVVRTDDPVTGRPLWRAVTGPPLGHPTSAEATDADAAPAATPVAGASAPGYATKSAALCAAAGEAAAALGRPPSARDLAWYLDGPAYGGPAWRALGAAAPAAGRGAGPNAPARKAGPSLAPLLAAASRTVLARQRAAGGHGMARACFAADRYALRGAVGPDAERPPLQGPSHERVHALDAAIERAALAEEHDARARLDARAARWRSLALAAFAAHRAAAARTALWTALRDARGHGAPDGEAHAWAEVAAASAHACDVLEGWVEAARRRGQSADVCAARARAVAAHRAHLAAFLAALPAQELTEEHAAAVGDPGWRDPLQGDAPSDTPSDAPLGTSPHDASHPATSRPADTADLAPYAAAAARLAGVPVERAARLYVGARRVARGVRAQVGPTPAARVDRVDALARLVAGVPARHTPALVREAVALLGPAVRDPAPLVALLGALPPGDATTRHAAVVALGLLGHPPRWQDTVGRDARDRDVRPADALRVGGDARDAATFVVAASLAGPDAPAAIAAVHAARPAAGPAARAVLDSARARLRAGLLLTAAEKHVGSA